MGVKEKFNLEFTKLESKLKEKAGIEKLDLDVLKTLNLRQIKIA